MSGMMTLVPVAFSCGLFGSLFQISGGDMKKGKYQSILVIDIDGPKSRGIAVQITGGK